MHFVCRLKQFILLLIVFEMFASAYMMKNNEVNSHDMIDDSSSQEISTNEENDYSDYVQLCRGHERETLYGYTELHWAAEDDEPEHIEEIYKNKKDNLFATLKCGWTPLHIAVISNNHKGAQKLLELSKYDEDFQDLINMSDKNEMTPLHLAVLHNKLNMVDMLIKNGADTYARTKRSSTILHIAFEHNYYEVAEKILNCTKFDTSDDGNILFRLADEKKNHKMLQLLVNKGPYISLLREYGLRALHIAIRENYRDVIQRFASEYMELDIKVISDIITRNNGYGFVQMAALYGNTDLFDMFAKNYQTIDYLTISTPMGLLLLHIAAQFGSIKILEYYIKKGITITLCDSNGWNILHHAALNKNKSAMIVQDIFKIIRKHMFEPEKIIQELLRQPAKTNCRPMDFACDPICKKLLTPVVQKNKSRNNNKKKK